MRFFGFTKMAKNNSFSFLKFVIFVDLERKNEFHGSIATYDVRFPANENTKLIFILPFISNSRSVSLTTYNISLLYSRSGTNYFKSNQIEKMPVEKLKIISPKFTEIRLKKFQFYFRLNSETFQNSVFNLNHF